MSAHPAKTEVKKKNRQFWFAVVDLVLWMNRVNNMIGGGIYFYLFFVREEVVLPVSLCCFLNQVEDEMESTKEAEQL